VCTNSEHLRVELLFVYRKGEVRRNVFDLCAVRMSSCLMFSLNKSAFINTVYSGYQVYVGYKVAPEVCFH
jgi:hypothetical protein